MSKKGFRQLLKERQESIDSLVCVGLDPLPEKFPHNIPHCSGDDPVWTKLYYWAKEIINATVPFTSMYKAQRAHWEAIPDGTNKLKHIISYIHHEYPDIPVFLDCKRGDIGRTQERYQIAHFDIDGADGINFSPYMGKDCLEYLVNKDHPERALVGLCYTSNPSAREVQDVKLADGRTYWEFMAETILKWAEELGVVENAGLVMAAAFETSKGSGNISSSHLSSCRKIVGNKLWFLIPGIGTQGGFIEETVKCSFLGYGSIAINSSSDIIFASQGEDFAEAAAVKTWQLRKDIRKATADVK